MNALFKLKLEIFYGVDSIYWHYIRLLFSSLVFIRNNEHSFRELQQIKKGFPFKKEKNINRNRNDKKSSLESHKALFLSDEKKGVENNSHHYSYLSLCEHNESPLSTTELREKTKTKKKYRLLLNFFS